MIYLSVLVLKNSSLNIHTCHNSKSCQKSMEGRLETSSNMRNMSICLLFTGNKSRLGPVLFLYNLRRDNEQLM